MKKSSENPLNEIIDAISRVAKGDYTTQIPLKGGNGHYDALAMGINRMIHDIRIGTEKLEQAKSYADNILSSIEDIIIILNADFTIKSLNRSGIQILGYPKNAEGCIIIDWADENEFYSFSVSDDGPGISPEFHDKIFIIFQTLEARDNFESTGVGLAIVKKLVEEQGGTIAVNSELGQGSEFVFTWPKKPKNFLHQN